MGIAHLNEFQKHLMNCHCLNRRNWFPFFFPPQLPSMELGGINEFYKLVENRMLIT